MLPYFISCVKRNSIVRQWMISLVKILLNSCPSTRWLVICDVRRQVSLKNQWHRSWSSVSQYLLDFSRGSSNWNESLRLLVLQHTSTQFILSSYITKIRTGHEVGSLSNYQSHLNVSSTQTRGFHQASVADLIAVIHRSASMYGVITVMEPLIWDLSQWG